MNEIILGINVRYNLYDGIDEFSAYEEFISNTCLYTENDTLNVHINSPGGRIDVGTSIVDALKNTKARVRCVVEQPSCSMAAIIALCGDELVMNDNTFLMFHNYSGMNFGKGSEMSQMMLNNDAYIKRMFEGICHPFLTKKELESINRDSDLYIYSDDAETHKRIRRHFKC